MPTNKTRGKHVYLVLSGALRAKRSLAAAAIQATRSRARFSINLTAARSLTRWQVTTKHSTASGS